MSEVRLSIKGRSQATTESQDEGCVGPRAHATARLNYAMWRLEASLSAARVHFDLATHGPSCSSSKSRPAEGGDGENGRKPAHSSRSFVQMVWEANGAPRSACPDRESDSRARWHAGTKLPFSRGVGACADRESLGALARRVGGSCRFMEHRLSRDATTARHYPS